VRRQEEGFRKMMVTIMFGLFVVVGIVVVFIAPAILNLAMDLGLLPRLNLPISL